MKIQEIIAAFLASQGQHKQAEEALAATDRRDWQRLVDETIRTAPETNRTRVARALKLTMDRPANGGPGMAADFVIKAEPHPMQAGKVYYRAWRVPHIVPAPLVDTGFVSDDLDALERRIVGMYVVRRIAKPIANNFLPQAEAAALEAQKQLDRALELGAIPALLDEGIIEFPGTGVEQLAKLEQLLGLGHPTVAALKGGKCAK